MHRLPQKLTLRRDPGGIGVDIAGREQRGSRRFDCILKNQRLDEEEEDIKSAKCHDPLGPIKCPFYSFYSLNMPL